MALRVLSWNVNKSSNREGRVDDQLAFLEDCAVDVVLLQEVRYGSENKWLHRWEEGLAEMGLGEQVHSCDWAAELADSDVPPHSDIGHDNGHITAVNTDWELTRQPQTIRDHIEKYDQSYYSTHFPEKILVSTLDTGAEEIELWNVRAVPGNGWGEEKVKILETVYDRLTLNEDGVRVLAGDFNTPDRELRDGQAIPFGYDASSGFSERKVRAEQNILKGLGHVGMLDVFREQHGYRDVDVLETSWNTKRFDHIIASEELTPTSCQYKQAGEDHSDHLPIIAEFEV